MPRLHIFNPSHEMSLAADSESYTPPKRIEQMERELAAVPYLWKEEEDIVVGVEALNEKGGYARLGREYIPCPWGWNKAIRRRLLHFGVPEPLMPTETQLAQWRRFASREFAADYSRQLYAAQEWGNGLVPNHMTFCHDATQLQEAIRRIGYPFITKTEYSSSGRGVKIYVRPPEKSNGIGEVINSYKPSPLWGTGRGLNILIDRFYLKLLDFALEYEVTCERVEYLGVSVFEASTEGKYGFNYVKPQSQLLQMIADTGIDMQLLTRLIDYNTQSLSQHLLGRYVGIAGIDMMAVGESAIRGQRIPDSSYKISDSSYGGQPSSIINHQSSIINHPALIHPCVELNFRMNMGVAAMKIYGRDRAEVEQELKRFDKSFRATLDGDRFSLRYQKA
ncbi:MAG: hypothetical protein MJY95_02505 [Bacteroidaceae bacterium]|nr:hypothetical protein [Bacteroidaceae bacterium]